MRRYEMEFDDFEYNHARQRYEPRMSYDRHDQIQGYYPAEREFDNYDRRYERNYDYNERDYDRRLEAAYERERGQRQRNAAREPARREFAHGPERTPSPNNLRPSPHGTVSRVPEGPVNDSIPVPRPVIDLDPANFNKVVLDPKKTVIVAFYAVWCKAPEMGKLLGQLQVDLAGEKDIVLGRVDADRYKDIFSHFDATTLPCILIFPKHDKTGIEYTGPRNEPALLQFIIFQHRGEMIQIPPPGRGRKESERESVDRTPPPPALPPVPAPLPPDAYMRPYAPSLSRPLGPSMLESPFYYDAPFSAPVQEFNPVVYSMPTTMVAPPVMYAAPYVDQVPLNYFPSVY